MSVSLDQVLQTMPLCEEHDDYLLARGATREIISDFRFCTWTPTPDPVAFPEFSRYGRGMRGELLQGRLVIPMFSPRGKVLGFEARTTEVKTITRYLTPEAEWNPVWLGLSPSEMQKVWDGGDIWLCEGMFDLLALRWIVPKGDVVLGCCRAKVTNKQLTFLDRFSRGWVHMVFDLDETGRKGTHGYKDQGKEVVGALSLLQRHGHKARDVPYVGGKDPGEIWLRGGVDALHRAFQGSI